MRRSSKFLALVLSVLMMVSVFSFNANAAFTDVSTSDEALSEAVSLLANLGITTGTSATTFGTNEDVTRQQMATFIYRLMKKGKSADTNAANTTLFTDLVDPFYNYTISWANDLGIIKGTSATTFNPTGKIKLQDAYVMLVRALGYEKDEQLVYPFGYIEKAEKIGLDEDIPSKVTYDTTLTRGNVAILLHNAFYADMATYEIGYEPTGYNVFGSDGENYFNGENMPDDVDIVAADIAGQREYKKYDTVAEKIYDVTKTVQRIVATPNYKLDEDEYGIERELTRDSGEDFVEFDVVRTNKDHKDDAPLGMVAFEKLGLEGKADDYFLADCVVYVKDDEVIAAESLLTKKVGIPNSSVKFEQEGSAKRNAYPKSMDDTLAKGARNTESRNRILSGKVTIDGVTGYFYNAPWSYSRSENFADKDSMNIRLLCLGADDEANPGDDDYVPAFNFEADKDAYGRGNGDFYATKAFERMDPKKDGVKIYPELYSQWGIYTAMGREGHMYEMDVWDCDSDGKIDFVWYKPYTVGFIDTESGDLTYEMHNDGTLQASISSVVNKDKEPTIYTTDANIEGVKPEDGKFAVAYVNGPANYIKIVRNVSDDARKVRTLERVWYDDEYMPDDKKGDSSHVIWDSGENMHRWGSNVKYIGQMGSGGEGGQYSLYLFDGSKWINQDIGSSPYSEILKNQGDSADTIIDGNILLYANSTNTTLSGRTDYVFVVPNHGEYYAYTDEVAPSVVDGVINGGDTYFALDIYEDGEIKTVPVKPVKNAVTKQVNKVSYESRPKTENIKVGNTKTYSYNFSPYVGKILIPSTNADGEYLFEIVPVELYDNKSVLKDDNAAATYGYYGYDDGIETAAFVKSSGTNYKFVKKGTYDVKDSIAPSQFVNITENTRIVIRGYTDDEDGGEFEYTEYNIDDLPDFSNTDMLKNIIYIVRNNPNSTKVENLVFMYAELVDDAAGSFAKNVDLRIVKDSYITKNEDENGDGVLHYNAFNFYNCELELGHLSVDDDSNNRLDSGAFALISNNKIADNVDAGSLYQQGDMCTSDVSVNDIRSGNVSFGYAVAEEYQEDSGFLFVEGSAIDYLITKNTEMRFIDLTADDDEQEVTDLEDFDVLNSTSKKYANGANEEIRIFIISDEVKGEDSYEEALLILVIKNEEVPSN